MDLRTGIQAIRALVDGPEAFQRVAEGAGDYDPVAFCELLAAHNLREWLRPALSVAGARELLPATFVEELEKDAEADARCKQGLLELSADIRAACAEVGIPTLFLKGLYFGSRLYGDVHRRHQYDVDVLVRPPDFERAVSVLAGLGFDATTNTDDDSPVERRLREIRSSRSDRAPHGVTIRRDGVKADLHWCLSSRSFRRIDEEGVWDRRRRYVLGGHEFETLSDEDALMFLLVSICVDLRRGACRQKNFLDLYLLLRELDGQLDGEAFLARRRAEGLLGLSVNVLAVFFCTWQCADEFPALAGAVDARRGLVRLADCDEALAVVTRPRGNPANRYWFRRVYPRSPVIGWIWRWTRDLPYTLGRWRAPGFAGIPGASQQGGA